MWTKVTGANSRPALQFESRGLQRRALVVESHGVLDPELPCWISSPSYCMTANDPARGGLGIEKQLVQAGYLVIGSCPNGDPVLVSFRDSKLPVFYLSHEKMHGKLFTDVMRKISDSIAAYDKALSTENSGIPLDYWAQTHPDPIRHKPDPRIKM